MIFDEISRNILRRFQWPRGGDCKYVGRPSVYRIARDLNVHPKVVRLRLKELFDSGLIRGVKFYTDDAFMPWKRYFVLINKTKGVQKIIYEHFKEFLQYICAHLAPVLFLYNRKVNSSISSIV